MALTSQDETDLILPLYQGARENPRFATFLERLRRRTEAEYIAIAIRRSDVPRAATTRFHAGADIHAEAKARGIESLHMIEDEHGEHLRPGRAYSVAEFVDHDPGYRSRRAIGIGQLGIADERVVRILDEAGISALLVLARAKPCSAADAALLSNLAPYVGLAIRNLVEFERQQLDAEIAAQGLGRSGLGWIQFDADARVTSIDPACERFLADRAGIAARPGERLRNLDLPAAEQLAAAAADFASGGETPACPLILCSEPHVEALLLPASGVTPTLARPPVMLALCRLPRVASPQRTTALAGLFDLPRREAELAIALADGMSIAEAATAMGLTLETARNYSKRLYAKLAVRGQAELVRLVYESSAVLA